MGGIVAGVGGGIGGGVGVGGMGGVGAGGGVGVGGGGLANALSVFVSHWLGCLDLSCSVPSLIVKDVHVPVFGGAQVFFFFFNLNLFPLIFHSIPSFQEYAELNLVHYLPKKLEEQKTIKLRLLICSTTHLVLNIQLLEREEGPIWQQV